MDCFERTLTLIKWTPTIPEDINLNIRDKHGRSLLFHITSYDKIAYLLENGTDPNIQDDAGNVFLCGHVYHIISWQKVMEIFRDISFKIKFNPNIRNKLDQHFLYHWHHSNYESFLSLANSINFIDGRKNFSECFNINYKNKNGETLMLSLVANGRPEYVRILVKYGADTLITNNQDMTALDIAKYNRYHDIIYILRFDLKAELTRQMNYDIATTLVSNLDIPTIKHMLDEGIINHENQQTMLHTSAIHCGGMEKKIYFLLEYGINPNTLDAHGRTMFEYWDGIDFAKLFREVKFKIKLNPDIFANMDKSGKNFSEITAALSLCSIEYPIELSLNPFKEKESY